MQNLSKELRTWTSFSTAQGTYYTCTLTKTPILLTNFLLLRIVPNGTILDCSEETWELTMDLNVRSAFRICQALIPIIVDKGNSCSIINMSSMASSLKGVTNRFAYSVSKAALLGLSKSIAADFIHQGIRSNAICPATVDTPSLRGRIADSPDPNQALKDFLGRQKMGRFGTPEEIAYLALYLASDEVLSSFQYMPFHIFNFFSLLMLLERNSLLMVVGVFETGKIFRKFNNLKQVLHIFLQN